MTLPFIIDPGFATGVCGILVGLICLLALRSHRIATATAHAELRSMVREQGTEWSGRIEQLELRGPVALGTGRREMRLVAEVSRLLSLK
jgi:hypothetical protein